MVREYLASVMLLSVLLTGILDTAVDDVRITTVHATCTEDGYQLHEEINTGKVVLVPDEKAWGHRYVLTEDESARLCLDCGDVHRRNEQGMNVLPRIDFYGDMSGVQKVMNVPLEMRFAGEGQDFECWVNACWTNRYSVLPAKRDYTITMYQDDDNNNRYRARFRNWPSRDQFELRASTVDATQARDLLASEIWRDVIAARPDVWQHLINSPAQGIDEGMLVTVWDEGWPQGLFTLRMCHEGQLYNLRSNHRDALLVPNGENLEEFLFREGARFIEWKTGWKLIYCGTGEYTDWAMRGFNQMIGIVLGCEGDQLARELPKHLDTDAALDYLLVVYALGLEDHASAKLAMACYDEGAWKPVLQDMDNAFGLGKDGYGTSPEHFLPVRLADGSWISGSGSLLWDKFINLYRSQLCSRYAELRSGALSDTALMDRLSAFCASIPTEVYDMDAGLYPAFPMGAEEAWQQMREYIPARMALLDRIFLEEMRE